MGIIIGIVKMMTGLGAINLETFVFALAYLIQRGMRKKENIL